MRADHSHGENPAQVCVLLYTLPACTHTRHITEPASTRRHLPAFLITFASTSPVKNTLFLPSPSESSSTPRRNRKTGIQTTRRYFCHVFFWSPTASAPSAHCAQEQDTHDTLHGTHHYTVPPTRRAHVDCALVKQRPLSRSSGKGKAHAGDNSGSNELIRALQNAFESNRYGPGSTEHEPEGENKAEAVDEEEAGEGSRGGRRR